MIVIIDYGMGNLRSVQKAFERIGVEIKISCDALDILGAEKLVLPGVGHFKKGMENLKEKGLWEAVNESVLRKKIPILGICLGMQLMTKHSEEGDLDGFGWINAETKKFVFKNNSMKIPHMGWNNVAIEKTSEVSNSIGEEDFFYFVHSYYVRCNDKEDILFKTKYGIEFVSGFQKGNVYGVQFHPEKSHDAGLKIIKNFVEI